MASLPVPGLVVYGKGEYADDSLTLRRQEIRQALPFLRTPQQREAEFAPVKGISLAGHGKEAAGAADRHHPAFLYFL